MHRNKVLVDGVTMAKSDMTMETVREMLESVDEYDGTFASAVRQGIKNAVRKHMQEQDV